MKNHEYRYLGTPHFAIAKCAACAAVTFWELETFGGAKSSFLPVGERKRGVWKEGEVGQRWGESRWVERAVGY